MGPVEFPSEMQSFQLVSNSETDNQRVKIRMPDGRTVGLGGIDTVVCRPIFVPTGDKFVPVRGQERSYESYRKSDSGKFKPEDLEAIRTFNEHRPAKARSLEAERRNWSKDTVIADWLDNIYLRVVVEGYMTLDFEIALLQIGRRILKRTVPQPSSQIAGLLETLDPCPGTIVTGKEDDNDDEG